MFALPWFRTLFIGYFDLEWAFRLIDLFLCHGIDIYFRFSIQILKMNSQEIVKKSGMELMIFLKDLPSNIQVKEVLMFDKIVRDMLSLQN